MDSFLINFNKMKERINLFPDVWMDNGDLPSKLGNIDFNKLWNLHPDDLGKVKIMEKEISTPRYQQSYDKPYYYSGMFHPALPLPEEFKPFLEWANNQGYGAFNMTVINYYRNGTDYIGKHSDNENQLVKDSPIISVSIGSPRLFRIRQKKDNSVLKDQILKGNSYIVMGGKFQTHLLHEIVKVTGKKGESIGRRINITFRQFK